MNEDLSIENEVGRLLRARGFTLATAESCTGGLIASRITAVAGSSDYYLGGVVAYSNAVKVGVLGVDAELLEEHGAVSAAVAQAMAAGACRRLGADIGVSTTGIAGPGGGSAEKPVGLVYIAVADSSGSVESRKCNFTGNRKQIQMAAGQTALEMIQNHLT